VIAGHRQANFTECPGNILYPLLPTIRLEVSGRPQPPIVSLVRATPVRFSPNGDGQADTTTLAFSLTKTAHWAMEVRDPAGKRIGSYSGDGSADSATWDGTGPGGHACPDGVYTAVLSASSELGVAAPRTVKMIIDTTPPEPPQVRVRPDVFSPNGDGSDDDVTVRYVTAERCDTRVSVLGADGKVLRRLAEWRSQPAGAHSSTWDGRVPAGGKLVPADEGMYALSVECRDAAANVSSQAASVTLDRTLGHPAATPQTISPNGDGVTDQTALGFRLTRQATVVVDVRVDGKRVRTFRLGSLDAGSHSVVWDGVTEAGVTLGSCRPTFTVTARSSLGVSSASAGLVIDLARPTLTAPATLSAKLGKAVSLVCTPRDAYSSTVDLSYSITDVTGAALAAGTLAGVATGRPAVVAWKAPARGVYAVTFTAADLGGNREEAPASTVLTVR